MGVSLSTARYLAPASFLYDFALQQYGLWSSPNMKEIHDRNLSFFSPNPYFIGAFFFPQQLFQLAWMYRLWSLNEKNPQEAKQLDTIRRFVPYYAVGNVCIGTWMFFWNSERMAIADVFVLVNTTTQLWYCYTQLEPMNTKDWSSILTHVVAKTFAGIGVLDLLHNTSVAFYQNQLPSTAVQALTGVGFAGLAATSDWILGGCLVFDLVGLATGQYQYGNKQWGQLLGGFAVGTAAIVGLRNYFRPPYISKARDYRTVAQDEVDDRV
ncbi:hypothetical protein BAUCODRAFT_31757 [Baudoinia panamericana UAMH 10762]|uniref:Uncharacterized protein n=1 Tax=Baudoinia panamericana (strain UAMH 10762) TaxID=717646 RepID=M2NFI3_BAUPA|nr:uncharacterized protein BAUCODRAFT_31757 [Baudoinia panamericana UAMH 10762]EMC97760.1 hypothetical protein BAUCODRAFT_31757 [Baudoinia panamericana UAMH 10762]